MELALGRNPEKGAMTTINCAVNPTLNSQQAIYYSSCRPAQANDTARYVLDAVLFRLLLHGLFLMYYRCTGSQPEKHCVQLRMLI